jgi:uncharacterized protein (DUF305 family)
MKRSLVIAVLFVAVACRNESSSTQQPTSDTQAASQSTAASATTRATASYDLQFIDTMSKHHLAAIEMARMAQSKVQLPGLKALTKRIPSDQQKEIDQMKVWRDQWYPGAPPAENMNMPGMSASMNMDMSHLQTMKPGRDYDVMFIDMMVPHHEGAVQMSKDALTRSKHQELKKLAQQIIDEQTKEIADMKQWKAKLTR